MTITKITLTYGEDYDTGVWGWVRANHPHHTSVDLEQQPWGRYQTDGYRVLTHDLLEHPSEPEEDGIADELCALGAMVYVRCNVSVDEEGLKNELENLQDYLEYQEHFGHPEFEEFDSTVEALAESYGGDHIEYVKAWMEKGYRQAKTKFGSQPAREFNRFENSLRYHFNLLSDHLDDYGLELGTDITEITLTYGDDFEPKIDLPEVAIDYETLLDEDGWEYCRLRSNHYVWLNRVRDLIYLPGLDGWEPEVLDWSDVTGYGGEDPVTLDPNEFEQEYPPNSFACGIDDAEEIYEFIQEYVEESISWYASIV